MKRLASILFILLILSIVTVYASPSDEPIHDLKAADAEGLGQGAVSGSLVTALIENTEIESVRSSPEFSLQAERMLVETDRSEIATESFRPFVETDDRIYYESEIIGQENRENHRLSVWPFTDHVTFEAHDETCNSIEPSNRYYIDRAPLVDVTNQQRDNNQTHVGETLRWQNCQDQTSVKIVGDFLVRLWEWDAELIARGERETLRSGQQNHEDLPQDAPDLSLIAGEAQEQFLFAMNATLLIPRLDGHHEIYLNTAVLNATNGYRFSETHGSLLGISLQGEEVTVDGGGLRVHATGSEIDEPIRTTLEGPIERLKIDGEEIPTTAATTPPNASPLSPLMPIILLTALGLIIAVGTVATAWHKYPRIRTGFGDGMAYRRARLFDRALREVHEYSADQPKKAGRWARVALMLQPSHPEAMAALGRAHFSERRYKKALKNFQDAIDAIDGDYASPKVPRDAAAFWAVDAARCLARLRLRVNDMHERDQLTEHTLVYARLACKIDPSIGRSLLYEDSLQDLREPILIALDHQDFGLP